MKINFNRLTDEKLRSIIYNIFDCATKEVGIKNDISVNVTVVGEKTIKQLNQEHRGINKVTDVLSFPMYERQDFQSKCFVDDPDADIGDIVICKKRAMQQADEYGHDFVREISFLALHGFLHLLGYDHMVEDEEKEMFSLAKKILQKNNIGR